MRALSPTSTHSMPVCSETSATPCTTASGAYCPPIASTAIAGIASSIRGRLRGFKWAESPKAAPASGVPPAAAARTRSRRSRSRAVTRNLKPCGRDQENRHLVRVFGQQIGIAVDVPHLDGGGKRRADLFDHLRHQVAQMASLPGNQGETNGTHGEI
jgi:hypothetical protein